MASISRESNGRRTIQSVGADKKRRSIRLGKVSQRAAEAVQAKVEHLVVASITGGAVDADTAAWVASLDSMLADKLAAVGLLAKREAGKQTLLGDFLDSYIASRVDVKPATLIVWGQAKASLIKHFGANRDMASIYAGHADAFKLFLVGQGLASTTISKRLQFARQFFRRAVRLKIIASNPFEQVNIAAVVEESRKCFVDRADIASVLEVCNPTWRTIVALSRFGGLRCPSETLSLKWANIDFARGRMIVESPKTEHHPNGASRVVPIFADLRPFMEEAFELAPDGAEYVIGGNYRQAAMTPKGWANANLRTQLERLLARVGVQPWPRLFHAMRASCETELVARFPLHVVAAWMGHDVKVAEKHYLRVTEGDFERAAAGLDKSGANPVQYQTAAGLKSPETPVENPVQNPVQQMHEMRCKASQEENANIKKPLVFSGLREIAGGCVSEKNEEMEDRGLEPLTFWLPARRSPN